MKESRRIKLATSGSRGVLWRANPRGAQKLRREARQREVGDWWIHWACPHGHIHRELVGPRSLATEEVQRKRPEWPCLRRQARPVSNLAADVINEYLAAAKVSKRSSQKLLTDESRDRVRVLLQTGLRKPEFLGLRWKDVDLKAGVLTIPRSKHGGETRRTFASRLAMEGVDLLAIKELGGWETFSTVQRYAHLSPGH